MGLSCTVRGIARERGGGGRGRGGCGGRPTDLLVSRDLAWKKKGP